MPQLNITEIEPVLIHRINQYIIKSPLSFVSYKKDTDEVIEGRTSGIIFSPNANKYLDGTWVNTNDYTIDLWNKDILCVSYFGGADLNSLAATESSSSYRWKRVNVSSRDWINDGDVVCFVGSLDDWSKYTMKNLMTSTPAKFKSVYVYCILINSSLPHFQYKECPQNIQVIRNICMATPGYKRFYMNGQKYTDNCKIVADTVYMVNLPRANTKHVSASTTLDPGEIFLKCKSICPPNTNCALRKDANLLAHHSKVHCNAPGKCCVINCTRVFSIKNTEMCRLNHYRRYHPITGKKVLCKDKRVFMRDGVMKIWINRAKILLFTDHPIVGMTSECISDEYIYNSLLPKLDDSKMVYGILYILGVERAPITIRQLLDAVIGSVLTEKTQRDEILADVLLICMNLAKMGLIDLTTQNQLKISLEEMHKIVPLNSKLAVFFFRKRVLTQLMKNFVRCLFDVNVVYDWCQLLQLKIMSEEYRTSDFNQFRMYIQQQTAFDCEVTTTKWFVYIMGRLHVHLHLLLMETNDDPKFSKFKNFICHAIQYEYNTLLTESVDQYKLKDLFYETYLHMRTLVFDLAISIPLVNDPNSDFMIATRDLNGEKGISLGFKFSRTERDDFTEFATETMVRKYPRLMQYHSNVMSIMSTVYTPLDAKSMYTYWKAKHWPWSGDLSGQQLKPKKIATKKNKDIVYAEFVEKNLPITDQFEEQVNQLTAVERRALVWIYEYFINDKETKDLLSLITHDTIFKLVHLGLCDNLLIPNVIPLYVDQHYAFLTMDVVSYVSPISTSSVSETRPVSQSEIIRGCLFDGNYFEYFSMFDNKDKLSVPEEALLQWKKPTSFVVIVCNTDPRFIYNISSFLKFYDITNYITKEVASEHNLEWGLVATSILGMRYTTHIHHLDRHPELDAMEVIDPVTAHFVIPESVFPRPISMSKFKSILRNLSEASNRYFLQFMTCTFDDDMVPIVKYNDLIIKDEIGINDVCGMCLQFGNKHVSRHIGIQLIGDYNFVVCEEHGKPNLCGLYRGGSICGQGDTMYFIRLGHCYECNRVVDIVVCSNCLNKVKMYLCPCYENDNLSEECSHIGYYPQLTTSKICYYK